jgi:threonine dehydrogenase-like Zn-dependent dehydrogenase
VTERGDEGVAQVREMIGGYGAHSVIEAVGTEELFYAEVHLHGGLPPVRRFLPDLICRIEDHDIDPGKVFDLTLPLDQAAEGYRAMDERRAIKTLLRP